LLAAIYAFWEQSAGRTHCDSKTIVDQAMTKLLLIIFFLVSLGTLSLAAASVPAPVAERQAGGHLTVGMPP
jgi:hypothetical protein